MANKFDELLTQVGTGKWNFLYFVSVCYWFFLTPPYHISGVYLSPFMKHTCLPPTLDQPVQVASDSCSYFVNVSSSGEVEEFPCTEFEYDTSVYENTLTSEFNLVCDRAYLRATYQSMFVTGIICSAFIGGYMADRFGRKKVVVVTLVSLTSLSFATSFLQNFAVIVAFRFIMGCMRLPAMFNLALEVCEIKYRGTFGILSGVPWALGTMAWGGIAYLIRDWRWLQFSITVPFVLFIPALILMDESPRWLIVRGRYDEAIKVLQKAARWNKTQLPSTEALQKLMVDIREELNQPEKTETSKTGNRKWKSLELPKVFSTRSIRIIVCIFSLNMFISELVFTGLSLSGSNYSADPFLFIVISGVMEIPGYIFAAPLINRFGRKWPSIWGFIISGLVILLLIVIPSNISWLVMTLAMLGRMVNSGAFMIISMYRSEVLPTEVRLQGVGITATVCQLGASIVPYITDYLGPIVPWAPSLIFGAVSLVAAVLMLPVPEMLGKPLPDTVDDLEDINLVPRIAKKQKKGTSDD